MVDGNDEIIAGHALLEAARMAGYDEVPIVRLSYLNDAQRRALRIALNALAEKSGWDDELLALEFKELLESIASSSSISTLPLPVSNGRASTS